MEYTLGMGFFMRDSETQASLLIEKKEASKAHFLHSRKWAFKLQGSD